MLHFADDTNLLYSNKSMKKLTNTYIMISLALVVRWLISNKISLNANKTEIIIFRSKCKQITKYFIFQMSGQRIHISNKVKYLGIQIEQHLD